MEKRTVQNSNDYQGVINDWALSTNYFESDPLFTVDEIVEMFRNFRFGEAEAQVIVASMMACGAKFRK